MRLTTKAILTVVALVFALSANAQPRPGGGGSAPSGGPSGAPSGLITKITLEQLAKLFSAAGFQSKVVDNGGKMVQTVFWSPDIYGGALGESCEKDGSGCHAFKIFVNFGKSTVDQKWVDAWNNSWLYVHASVANNGSLIFDWDVGLLTGVTPEYIETAVKLFKQIVDQSTDFKP